MLNQEELRKEFEASKDLQIEFGDDFGAFFALKKHEDEVAKRAERKDRHRQRKAETTIDEPKLRSEFAASAALKSEFGGNVDSYLAFKRADAKNEVRKSSFGVVTSAAPKAEEKTSASAPGQKKTEKLREGIPITKPARDAISETARRAKIQQESELEQYAAGAACDSNEVPLEV